ncbi:MAG TPA: hypothetical protein VJ506_02265 [Candidatus Limnocylindrales bacterium]|nr:hypothetical protein [Candidatus Limnocylindrales bacterium]
MKRSRVIAISLATIAVIGVVALNVTDAVAIPFGPLGDQQPPVPDVAGDTIDYAPGRVPEYLSPLVENLGPVAVTIVRVTPIGVTVPGSVEILGSRSFNSDDPSQYGPTGLPLVMLGVQPDPGPGWASPEPATGVTVDPKGPAQYQGRAFLVRVTPDPTEETAVLRFDVEYTIGPFHFVATAWGPVGTTLVFCGRDRPATGSNGCQAR